MGLSETEIVMVSKRTDISVIIPTYRPADYLWQCLDSLCQQTLDKARYEVIIVLNGEIEPYKSRIEEFITNAQRATKTKTKTNFRLLTTERAGVSGARNMGIDAAEGEYIAFIDDDDWVSPTYLEQLLSVATPETVAISNTISVDEATMQESAYRISKSYEQAQGKKELQYTDVRQYFSGPCMKLFHRQLLGADRFDTTFTVGEDSNYMFLISRRLGRVALTDESAIYYRRVRSNSANFKKKNIWQRLAIACKQIVGYSRIYWRHPMQYRFGFYLTRVRGAVYSILVSF